MAFTRGQVDRFGRPIPSSPGIQVLINSDGTDVQQRNRLILPASLTASDSPDDDASSLSVNFTSLASALGLPVTLVNGATLTAATGYTLAPFTAGAYRKIIAEFVGVTAGGGGAQYVNLQYNADGTLNYQFEASNNPGSAVIASGDVVGNITSVPIAFFNDTSVNNLKFKIEFDVATNGYLRFGRSESNAARIGVVLAGQSKYETAFCWNNSATNVTFFTLAVSGGSITGILTVKGYP